MYKNKQIILNILNFAGAHEPQHPIQRISLETNSIAESYDNQQKHHHNKPHHRMENHKSYLICPGKSPIEIGSNQPVSINIYINNPTHRNSNQPEMHQTNNENASDEIYLRIVEKEFNKNHANNNHHNHHHHHRQHHYHKINAYYNNKLITNYVDNTLSASDDKQNIIVNKVRRGNNKNNLIINNKQNSNDHNNNNNNKDVENGNVKHIINIYHWIVHSTADEFVSSEKQIKSEQNLAAAKKTSSE